MKLLKLILIFVTIICAVFLLTGCRRSSEEDEKRIVHWLDNTYGKDSYTIKKDPEYRDYFLVRLNKYPDLEFSITIAYDVKVGSSYLWTNVDEIFCEYAIKQFKKSYAIGSDNLHYDDSLHYIYFTEASSLEELKNSYDKMISFITFASEQYPVLVDTEVLGMRMDVHGIRLKGRDDSDKWIHLDIAEVKDKKLNIKSYEEIYNELKPMLITHPENPKGLTFHADVGRSFILGSDTFEDCLYKSLVLKDAENNTPEKLQKIILQPGETSEPYTFESESCYEFTTISLQAKNLSSSPCSLLDATIVKAIINPGAGKSIYIDPVWIHLEDNKKREWIDPYKALGISPPKTEQERKEGVPYKNAKVLFEMCESYTAVRNMILTFQE